MARRGAAGWGGLGRATIYDDGDDDDDDTTRRERAFSFSFRGWCTVDGLERQAASLVANLLFSRHSQSRRGF